MPRLPLLALDGAVALADKINEVGGTLKRGSLIGHGDTFGGGIDNIHTAVGATAEPDSPLVVRFDQDETLIVWNPIGGVVSTVEFRIEKGQQGPLGVV